MRKLAVFLTLAMLFMAQLYGQTNRTVTGKVTDESGNPLVGVSVTAVGTAKTTVTDAKGNYSIQVTDKTTSLKFSSVGFGDLEARLGNRAVIDANLISEAKALSEVVVVGYGVQQRKSFTGSSSKVCLVQK